MPPIELDESAKFQEVFASESPKPFIVHYYTTWCSACRNIKPIILQAADDEEFADIPIYMVDCDVLGDETSDFIESVPTTIAYRLGQSFGYYQNDDDYDSLKEWIDCYRRGCRLVDSISDLPNPSEAPVADDEQASCVTSLETKEELYDFIQANKHAVVWADDPDYLPSWGIPHIFEHLAPFSPFEQLKFGQVDGQQEGIVDTLCLPTPFVPALVYLRKGALFGLKGIISVESAADLHVLLKDFLTALKIADTAEESGALEASFQKVSLDPETTKPEGRETDAESPGSSADPCVEILHAKNPSIVEITSSEQFKEITSSHSRVVVQCYSNDVYSTAMSLVHDRVASLPAYDEMHFFRVDIDEHQALLEEMGIEVNSQETLILVEGKVVARINHAEMNEFKSWLTTHVKGEHSDEHKDSTIVLCKYNALRGGKIKGQTSPILARNVHLRAAESKASVTSVASTLADVLVPCTGDGARKIKPGLRDRLLGLRAWKDQEAHCLFTPIPGDDGIEVACAVRNKSRVSITVAHTPSLHKGEQQVTFGMGFSVNVNVKARFTSAIFCVTFERYVDESKRVLLNIHDLSPRDEKGEGTEVQVGAEQALNAGFQAGAQGAVLQGGLTRQSNKSYTLKTCSRVRGQGLRTPTATWTFEENPGEAGKEGLEPEYPLHVYFSHQNTEAISIRFYAEAVLLEGSRKTVMTIGNEKELFHRELILSA